MARSDLDLRHNAKLRDDPRTTPWRGNADGGGVRGLGSDLWVTRGFALLRAGDRQRAGHAKGNSDDGPRVARRGTIRPHQRCPPATSLSEDNSWHDCSNVPS